MSHFNCVGDGPLSPPAPRRERYEPDPDRAYKEAQENEDETPFGVALDEGSPDFEQE